MRYSTEQKRESRERLLQAVGRGFRKRGFGGIGVDGLAKEGDVTSGAFYSHFNSKDAAFKEALAAGLDELKSSIRQLQEEKDKDWLEAFVDFYLNYRRTCDLSESCALQSLTCDVIRADGDVKFGFETKLREIAGAAAEGLVGGSADERLSRALAMLSILAGGVTMARAVTDPKLSEMIAQTMRNSALLAARGTAVT